MGVLEQALSFCGPDDDGVVCTSRGEPLAILRVREAVDRVFVALDLVEKFSSWCTVHKDEVSYTDEHLVSVGTEADTPNLVRLIGFGWRHGNLLLPFH